MRLGRWCTPTGRWWVVAPGTYPFFAHCQRRGGVVSSEVFTATPPSLDLGDGLRCVKEVVGNSGKNVRGTRSWIRLWRRC